MGKKFSNLTLSPNYQILKQDNSIFRGLSYVPFNTLQYFSLRIRCVSLQGKIQRLSEHNLVTLFLETLKLIADLFLLVYNS